MTAALIWLLVAVSPGPSDQARVIGEFNSRTGCEQVLAMRQPNNRDTLVCVPKTR